MSRPEFEQQWKLLRDNIPLWWDKLSDNDVDQVAGRYERLISTLHEKYGYSRFQAEAAIALRMEPRRKPETEQPPR